MDAAFMLLEHDAVWRQGAIDAAVAQPPATFLVRIRS
jgi:hypothetical protein